MERVKFLLGCLLVVMTTMTTGVFGQTARYSEAEQLLLRGRSQEALELLQALMQDGDRSAQVLFYAGKANEELMRFREAYTYYKEWSRLEPDNRDAAIAVARLANQAGQTAEALQCYQRLAEQDSLHFTINYSLGRVYQQTGKYLEALHTYSRLLSRDTTNSVLFTRMGECYQELGVLTYAVAFFSEAFYLNKYNAGLAIRLGNIALKYRKILMNDELATIAAVVDTAYLYTPDFQLLRRFQGIVKYLNKQYKEARVVFNDLLTDEDTSFVVYKYAGLTAYQMRNYPYSRTLLSIADEKVAKDGNHPDLDVAMKLAESYIHMNNTGDAFSLLEEIETQITPSPQFLAEIQYFYGFGYSRRKEPLKAIDAYWKSYLLYPDNPAVIQNFAYQCQQLYGDKTYRSLTREEQNRVLFASLLFLEHYTSSGSKAEGMKEYCRVLITLLLEDMFFEGNNTLTVTDPDGKTYTYSTERLRELMNL